MLYKPRQGGTGRGFEKLDEEMLEFVKKECKDLLFYFGYAKSNHISNENAFFDFGDTLSQEEEEQFRSNSFTSFNDVMMEISQDVTVDGEVIEA